MTLPVSPLAVPGPVVGVGKSPGAFGAVEPPDFTRANATASPTNAAPINASSGPAQEGSANRCVAAYLIERWPADTGSMTGKDRFTYSSSVHGEVSVPRQEIAVVDDVTLHAQLMEQRVQVAVVAPLMQEQVPDRVTRAPDLLAIAVVPPDLRKQPFVLTVQRYPALRAHLGPILLHTCPNLQFRRSREPFAVSRVLPRSEIPCPLAVQPTVVRRGEVLHTVRKRRPAGSRHRRPELVRWQSIDRPGNALPRPAGVVEQFDQCLAIHVRPLFVRGAKSARRYLLVRYASKNARHHQPASRHELQGCKFCPAHAKDLAQPGRRSG